jgi:hypothetical protein
MFCSETVPLARMKKLTYSNSESFEATIEVAHFGELPIENAEFICRIINERGDTITKEVLQKDKIEIGNCTLIGSFHMPLGDIKKSQKLKFEVQIAGTDFRNMWDFWVYPENQVVAVGNVLVTDRLDNNAEMVLRKGGSVMLLNFGKIKNEKGARVAIGFSSIFWNTAWTNNQAPHTLGILCDPQNAFFSDFPTEFHSNWQWWDPVSHSQAMILDGFPDGLKPIVQPIDTWFENRRLALVFESKTGGGKLLVCSIDLKNIAPERLVSKQLLVSAMNYMNSDAFNPKVEVDLSKVKSLVSY